MTAAAIAEFEVLWRGCAGDVAVVIAASANSPPPARH